MTAENGDPIAEIRRRWLVGGGAKWKDVHRLLDEVERLRADLAWHAGVSKGYQDTLDRIAEAANTTQYHINGHAMVPASTIDHILGFDGSHDPDDEVGPERSEP